MSPINDGNNQPENWLGNTLPLNNGTEEFIFGPAARSTVTFYNDLNARKISIVGNYMPYELDDDYGDLFLGSGGLLYAPAVPVKSFIGAYTVNLVADQTWDIQSGELGFYYDITGTGRLTKTGAGTLIMANAYSWTGGVTLNSGPLVLENDRSYWTFGSGNFIVGPAPGGLTPPPVIVTRSIYGNDFETTLTNAVELNGLLTTRNEVGLNLTGPVTLNTDTTIKSTGDWLVVEGAIADGPTATPAARKLTVDSKGAVILAGTNTYSGGTHVENGALIFATVGSLPAAPVANSITSSANGYIGFGDDGTTNAGASLTNPQGLFLDRFNKAATFGTIGFDTDPDLVTANNYSGNIDLSATPTGTSFAASTRLGSATHAILSGTITPQGTATDPYRFGGGGGFLQVDSALTGARSLVVDSPAAQPLTLRVTNEGNDYTGGTSVTNSALILGSNGTGNPSFPTGAADITINAGGYVGFEFWEDVGDPIFVASSLAKINPASVGVLGFDNYAVEPADINLSSFTNALYLGTATQANMYGPGLTLSGIITPAGGVSAPYRFAGYKGGDLEIASTLTGANGVLIGDPGSPATFGDYLQEKYSTVALTGNNSGLSGNVTLYGGQLLVGQSNGTPGTNSTNALGTGTLVVTGMTLPPEWADEDNETPTPQLGTTTNGIIIPNNVTLTTDLNIAEFSDFTLTGKISGPGELYLESGDYITRTKLTLGHATLGGDTNDFTGGIYLSGYSRLDVAQNHATGTGPLGFGYSSNAEVYFKTAAPVIGGLMSKDYGDSATLYAELTNTVLTINQSFDSRFTGYFRSTKINNPAPDDHLRIVKSGAGTLRLDQGGLYFYHGTTESTLAGTPEVSLQINQGRVIIGDNYYLESPTPTIWVHGGTLALDRRMDYFNPLSNPIVVDNGGRLAGRGYFASSVAIGAGAVLAPGITGAGEIGLLQFDQLALNAGGVLEWQIQDPASPFGHDLIDVGMPTTLVVNAGTTPDDPLTTGVNEDTRFTLKVISLALSGAPGLLNGFDPSQGYSWAVFAYDSLTGFDPARFNVDISGFANSLAFDASGNGIFHLTDSGNALMLNFTPVPEPSTYALLALGLGFVGLTAWRRSRHGS